MHKSLNIIIVAAVLSCICGCDHRVPTIVGNVDIYEGFPSEFVEARTIRVWSPDGYDSSIKYDVIYMHDGQNLFDSSTTWNHQEWGVDETLTDLRADGRVRPTLVVGVDNSPTLRFEEYYPSRIVEAAPEGLLPEDFKPLGDEYLRFLVEEVKPFIDSHYSTWGDPAHTFVMGSSCGGLISAYALCERPDVFGGAACLSTHSTLQMPGVRRDMSPMADAFLSYLRERLPRDDAHRLYMDCGDRTIDATYADTQAAIDALLDSLPLPSVHRAFPGAAHAETDWQARLEIPVLYLVGEE